MSKVKWSTVHNATSAVRLKSRLGLSVGPCSARSEGVERTGEM